MLIFTKHYRNLSMACSYLLSIIIIIIIMLFKMATSTVCGWSTPHDLSVQQQSQYSVGCIDCQKLKDELNAVRMELISVKEIVNVLNQDLASINVYRHNLFGEELFKSSVSPWVNPKYSKTVRFTESSVKDSSLNISNKFQVL